jgi:hypothetical protein
MIWWLVRSTTTKKDLIVIPGWLAIYFVTLVEWIFRVFSLEMMRPPTIVAIGSMVHNASYSIDKTKEKFGWRPDGSLEALETNLRRSIQCQIENDGERRRG